MKLYDWNALEDEPLNPLMSRKVIHGGSLTVANLHLLASAVVPEHSHAHEQLSMVERGVLKFHIAGREQIVRAGEALLIAPHEPHGVEALEETFVTDVFSPAREDWIRGDDAYLRR
ncbi:MAG: cupin domain-containing protein [Bryobacteraceae bacterium]|jgi:quercetin dioxygenase-like cupin family protein